MKKYTIIKSIRLDKTSLANMKKNMEVLGMENESEYIRYLIQNDMLDRLNFDKKEFMKIRRDIAGAGNNLNQIAHNMNMNIYSSVDRDELDRCIEDVREIKSQLEKMIKELF